MARKIQIRRGTSAQHTNFTGAIGEVTMDTTNKTLRVHDGTTAGGIELARKDKISSLAAPSAQYINMTLDVSGSTYTAPADGWIYVRKRASATNQFLALVKIMQDNTVFEAGVSWSTFANQDLYANIPVSCGEKFKITYSANGTAASEFLKFLYAKGAQ